jgi:hypothetical protein
MRKTKYAIVVLIAVFMAGCIGTKVYLGKDIPKDAVLSEATTMSRAIDPTEIPAGGTWGNVRTILNNNFDNIHGDITALESSVGTLQSDAITKDDTTAMLTHYIKGSALTSALTSGLAGKLSLSDTASMLAYYVKDGDLASGLAGKQNTLVSGTSIKTINSQSLLGSGNIVIEGGSGGEMIYPGAGIPISTGSGWGTSITDNSGNWNTAHSWGDHALAGYLTSGALSGYVPTSRTINTKALTGDISLTASDVGAIAPSDTASMLLKYALKSELSEGGIGIGAVQSEINDSLNINIRPTLATAYADRLKWDGGATGLTAATGRTSLGATTVGGNLFTLTNPGAISFLTINANNTVSTRTAAEFRSDIGLNITRSGAHSLTLTTTANTSVTLPTSGTLMTNPMTSTGDIIYGGTSGTATRLAAGTNGHVLTLSGGVPTWAASAGGGLTQGDVESIVDNYITNGTELSSVAVMIADTAAMLTDYIRQSALTSALMGKENSLGNPAGNGYILSSTTAGVRSWVEAPSGSGVSMTDVRNVVRDSLNAIRTGSVQGLATADTLDKVATRYWVNSNFAGGAAWDSTYAYKVIDSLKADIEELQGEVVLLWAAINSLGDYDFVAPKFLSAEIEEGDATRVVVNFDDDDFNADSIPPTSAFTLLGDNVAVTLTGVSFDISDASILYLDLDEDAEYGVVYTLSYTPGSPPLIDLDGNITPAWTNRAVLNSLEEPAPPDPEPENMIANGTFDNSNFWDTTNEMTITGGVASYSGTDASASPSALFQIGPDMLQDMVSSTTYTLSFTVVTSGAGLFITITNGNQTVTFIAGTNYNTGTHVLEINTPANLEVGGIRFNVWGNANGTIDNITMFEK